MIGTIFGVAWVILTVTIPYLAVPLVGFGFLIAYLERQSWLPK